MTVYHEAARLLCVGLSHHTAPVEQREIFAGLGSEQSNAAGMDIGSISERTRLSTCNRLEWYLAIHEDAGRVIDRLCDHTHQRTGLSEDAIRLSLSIYEGPDAVRHLFDVAAGLESMVLGESEILGQVSRTYVQAVEMNTAGPLLDALFRAAIRTGKRVRSETALGSNPASVSSVALDLATRELGDLTKKNILVIGMGEMGTLTQKLLRAQGARNVVLVNRTLDRARSLAEPDWTARPMEELPSALADADLVISATSAPHAIVTAQDLKLAAGARSNGSTGMPSRRPWLIIDLALPRDVEPKASEIAGVTLYDLDGLQAAIERSLARRQEAAPAARAIVAEELSDFRLKLCELEVRPLVVELRTRAEGIREQELARTLRFLGDVEPDTVAHLQHLTRALVNKLLHSPTVRIKEMARNDRSEEYLDTVCDLFGLDSGTSPL